MASATAEDLAQQQAMIATMFSQLPPEHQAQIQGAVGDYSQQLTAQGVAAEQLQHYVWSYYTQCVSTFFAQLPPELQQAVLAPQATPSSPQVELQQRGDAHPQEPQPKEEQQQQSHEEESQPRELHTDVSPVAQPEQTPDQVPVQLHQTEDTVEQEPLRLLSEQESQILQTELQAQEIRKQQEELEAEQARQQQELKEQQQQFEKSLLQKMDPALAARFAKQREKGEVVDPRSAEVRAAAAPPKNLDPVLAKRWSAMQERQEGGEDAVKSIDERVADLAKSRQEKPETELAKKLARRGEKVESNEAAMSPRSQAQWRPSGDSELSKLMAKQKEKNQERIEKGDMSPGVKTRDTRDSATGELAEKLARQRTLELEAAKGQEPGVAAGKENEAPSAAERTRLSLPRGQTVVHSYTWPRESSVNNLRWNAVVLDDLTVDLEVSVVLKPGQEGSSAQTIILQRNARGGTFVGSFAPSRDRRLVVGDAAETDNSDCKRAHREVETVVFTFSNSFSWFTAKDVEFMTVYE